MSKLPFMQFYPADWIRDTRILSLSARGAWIDLICAAWDSPERGKLVWSWDMFRRFVGLETKPKEAVKLFAELRDSKVGEFSYDQATKTVTIMLRRVIREEKKRKQGVERTARFRNASVTQMQRPIYQKSEVIDQNSDIKSQEDAALQAAPDSSNLETKKEGTKRPLSKELEEVSTRIYRLDQIRYKRLFEWIGQKRKAWYSDKLLMAVLLRFEPYALEDISWWPYLNRLAEKEQSKVNAQVSEAEAEHYKQEEREWLDNVSHSKLRVV